MAESRSPTPPWLTWKPSPCRLNSFSVYLLERQTGPCLRWDYEFARDVDGKLLEFRNEAGARAAIAALDRQQLALSLEPA